MALNGIEWREVAQFDGGKSHRDRDRDRERERERGERERGEREVAQFDSGVAVFASVFVSVFASPEPLLVA